MEMKIYKLLSVILGMSNSSSRSVWSFIIKVIITVATAVGGLIGVQSCM